MSAAGILNVDGTLLGQADGNLRAGTDITGRGKLAFGTGATLRAGRDISLTGALLAGDLNVEAVNSLSVNDRKSTGNAGGGHGRHSPQGLYLVRAKPHADGHERRDLH